MFIGCSAWFGPNSVDADRTDVAAHLTGIFPSAAPQLSPMGAVHSAPGASVQAVRFEAPEGFTVAGALWTPKQPTRVGVVVAHGHYGQGKSGAEAQEIAHRLAARGVWVLSVDSPGVEEGDVPGRQIHFSEGAHNRGLLVAGGSSALALQLAHLHGAASILESLGAEKIGVTGASGGAVASFYLAWLDDRVQAAVLASPPPIPREAAASGCACDHVPGHPGPDPGVLAQLNVPSLWMADVQKDRPEGLRANADFDVYEGPHSYTEPMQRSALDFFATHLGIDDGPWLDATPQLNITSGPFPADAWSIADLKLPGVPLWEPNPMTRETALVECEGEGPVVLALGTEDVADVGAAGFRVCTVRMPAPGDSAWDEAAWVESIGTGEVRANVVLAAVEEAYRRHRATGIWSERVWGLVAGASGHPFVVYDPVLRPTDLKPNDPAWVHVPGAWQGSVAAQLSGALGASKDRVALAKALKTATGG